MTDVLHRMRFREIDHADQRMQGFDTQQVVVFEDVFDIVDSLFHSRFVFLHGAMLFQVAERSLRFCRLFETKNVNGKIRFFRVRPGRILTIARIVKGRRQAKFNVLFSSSLHSRVHQCPLRMLRASVVRACPSRIFSSAKIVKAEKKTGACSQFSEACPIFCKDKRFIRFPDASSGKNRNFGKKLRNLCQGTIDQPRITGAESVIRVISPVNLFPLFRAEYPILQNEERKIRVPSFEKSGCSKKSASGRK